MKSPSIISVPIWLLILIAGLPLFSETAYAPSLPEIAHALNTTESMTEYTLTIYLAGFGVGTLLWGNISDRTGRRFCMLGGYLIYILGCLMCYFSNSIEMLMFSRFIQALGGSVGSIIGQAISRDAFHGINLGKIYSLIGGTLVIFPAIGPIAGGVIVQNYHWSYIFLFLMAWGCVMAILIYFYLPETHLKESRIKVSIKEVLKRLINDKQVIGFCLIVGLCNGISFSYYAEGSFYLVENLGLSPGYYGYTFIGIATVAFVAALISKRLQNFLVPERIMSYGLFIVFTGASLLTLMIICNYFVCEINNAWLIGGTVLCMMMVTSGLTLTTSNALAKALIHYKECTGTASSIFGFSYYCIVSATTFLMGSLHNSTLLPMPLLFLSISIFMLLIRKKLIN